MIEQTGNIWEDRKPEDFIVITTNGTIQKNGHLVMGGGIAKEAKELYRWLPEAIGQDIIRNGLQVEVYIQPRLIIFPVKYHVWQDADLNLIEHSTKQLLQKVDSLQLLLRPENESIRILIPRPGCGLGNLKWENVKPILERYLCDDRFVIFSF